MAGRLQITQGDEIKSERNRYVVIQRLREGGNSVPLAVFCIDGPLAGIPCVFKVFENADKPLRALHFIAEGELLETLSHPSVLAVLDRGTISVPYRGHKELYPFQVTRLYKSTLLQRLRERASLVERTIIATQLLAAVRYIGLLPDAIIHRDIKPANIFLDERSCVLADFGLYVKQSQLDTGRNDVLFREAVGRDMPGEYPIPDLLYYAASGAAVSPAANVFQVGLVLCELFTGMKPALKGRELTLDIDALPQIGGRYGTIIRASLQQMLHTAAATRASIDSTLEALLDVGKSLCIGNIDLNGKFF